MNITATHINYYIVCPRKLWLFANGIHMEHTSAVVADGKLLHETSYPQRAERYTEIALSASDNGIELSGKIDFYDAKEKIIHEIKRGNKVEKAHEWQVKYYIWLLMLNGIEGAKGIIEYPKLRERKEVSFTESDALYLKTISQKIRVMTEDDTCPPVIHSKICKSCSYYELCYVGGEEEG